MLHFFRTMPQGNVVGANSSTIFQIPLGPSYRTLYLKHSTGLGVLANEATMRANILRLRIRINGIARWDVSGDRYISMLKYYGYTIDAGVLPIVFSRKYARTMPGEENTVFGTANIETLTVEVDLGAAATPTLTLDSDYTPESRDLGPIVQLLENTYTAATAGTFEVSSLPKSNGSLVGMHLFSSQVTAFEMLVDNVQHYNADLATIRSAYKETGRVPQAGVQHIEPTYLDRFDDALSFAGVQDYRIKLTMAAAGSVPILTETMFVPLAAGA